MFCILCFFWIVGALLCLRHLLFVMFFFILASSFFDKISSLYLFVYIFACFVPIIYFWIIIWLFEWYSSNYFIHIVIIRFLPLRFVCLMYFFVLNYVLYLGALENSGVIRVLPFKKTIVMSKLCMFSGK